MDSSQIVCVGGLDSTKCSMEWPADYSVETLALAIQEWPMNSQFDVSSLCLRLRRPSHCIRRVSKQERRKYPSVPFTDCLLYLFTLLSVVKPKGRYMAGVGTAVASSSGGGQGQPEMDKELRKAATSGDSTSMKDMVASRDPSILLGKTPQGNTCLHISSSYGHEGFCREVLLLEESLLKAVNLDEETPLIVAVRSGCISLAYFLLKRCREPRLRKTILQKDRFGFNALHHAILNGHKNLALYLIAEAPALSQATGKCNESPLFFAVRRNFTHIYDKLMQYPNCAYSGGQHGYNCLHAAVRNGDQALAQTIMDKHPELAREADMYSCSPIRDAVLFGKIDILRIMLEHDSTLGYEINSTGSPLLLAAADRGRVAAARELLKYCPDAPYSKEDGKTLLHVAALHNNAKFVEFVLKTPLLRRLVNVQDNEGKTALHYAVQECNPRVVVALLSHEDVDATLLDNSGFSAAWGLSGVMGNAKTLNWNEVMMLMSKANPQDAASLHNLHVKAMRETTEASRKDAKSLTQRYTTNTSLVAILITTITFAAAFTLPGGYSSAAGSEGLPIMSQKVSFKAFLISDTLAMCSSFAVAFICIVARWEDYEFLLYYRSFTKKLMWFAYMATTTAFSTGLYTVLSPRLHWLAIAICVLVALLPIFTWMLGEWPVLKLRFRLRKTFNSDLLDMV
ncbi:hypothetical protein QYE76_059026 [Lolium multiflorum]|uniref:PGG domain-containing protein n=1 Tax=Lolium multiflorum TaxID=4521 RepID=A0AAD8WQG9_LOLMU|nr:hypothetical protein QYE76_059026 [Lolium multiflorum]